MSMENPEERELIARNTLDFLDTKKDSKYWDKDLEKMQSDQLGLNFRIALTGKTPHETREREQLLMQAIDKVIDYFVTQKKDPYFTYTRRDIRRMIEDVMKVKTGDEAARGEKNEEGEHPKSAGPSPDQYFALYTRTRSEMFVLDEKRQIDEKASRRAISGIITKGDIFADAQKFKAFIENFAYMSPTAGNPPPNIEELIGMRNEFLEAIIDDPRLLVLIPRLNSGLMFNLVKILPDDATRGRLIRKLKENRVAVVMDQDATVAGILGMLSDDGDKKIILEFAKKCHFEFSEERRFTMALNSSPSLAGEIVESFGKKLVNTNLDAFASAMLYSDETGRKNLIRWNEANIKTQYQYFASVLSYMNDPAERDRMIFETSRELVFSNGFAFANACRFCSPSRQNELLNDPSAKALFENEMEAQFDDIKNDNAAYQNISFLSNFLAKLPGYGEEVQIKKAMDWLTDVKSPEPKKQKAVLLLMACGQKIDKLTPEQLRFCAKTLLDTARTRTDIEASAGNTVFINLAKEKNYNMASFFSCLIALEQQAYGKPYWEKTKLFKVILEKREAMKDQPLIMGTTVVSFAHERGTNPETMTSANDSFPGTEIAEASRRSNAEVKEVRMAENCSSTGEMLEQLERTPGPVTLHLAGHGLKGIIHFGMATDKPESGLHMSDLFEVMAKDPDKVRQIIFKSCYSDQNSKILINLWRTDPRTASVTPPTMLTSSNDNAPSLTAPMDAWDYFVNSTSPDKTPTWGDYWERMEGRSMALAWKDYFISDPAIFVPVSPGSSTSMIIG